MGWNGSNTYGVRVDSARISDSTSGSAGSVAWGNVTGKPSYIMYYQGFTLDANTMDANATGFTYAVNAPYTGPIIRISEPNYSLWFNAPYSGGGYGLAFRTRNGDTATINPWRYPAVYGVNANGGGDLYATAYYDSDNTAYFTNPAGQSSMYGVAIRTDIAGSTDTGSQLFLYGAGNTTTSAMGFKNGGVFASPTGNGDGWNTLFTMDTPGRLSLIHI